jgi:predicted pyridoxine 5'-phosphate oxidase superfamily flavin-nucleotide-binding protein
MEINEQQKQMIETLPLAISTVNIDGSPNLIVVTDRIVVSKTEILIRDNYMKQTIFNIQKDNRICLGVWNSTEGYKFIGKAEYFDKGEWFDYVQNKMERNNNEPAKGAILVTVEKIIKLG